MFSERSAKIDEYKYYTLRDNNRIKKEEQSFPTTFNMVDNKL